MVDSITDVMGAAMGIMLQVQYSSLVEDYLGINVMQIPWPPAATPAVPGGTSPPAPVVHVRI